MSAAKDLHIQSIELLDQLLGYNPSKRYNLEAFEHSLEYPMNVSFDSIAEVKEKLQQVEKVWGMGLELETWNLSINGTEQEFDQVSSLHFAEVFINFLESGVTAETLNHWSIVIKESEYNLNWETIKDWCEHNYDCDVESPADYAQEQYRENMPEIFNDEIFNVIDWQAMGERMLSVYPGELIDGKLYSHND